MAEIPVDPVALRAHLDRVRPGLVRGELTVELIQGGRSNLTYLVGDGATTLVLRRPPLGHVLSTAHDMSREYRVLSALAATAVPVPAVVAWCADPQVIGAPFYLMERVDGVVYRDAAQAAVLGPVGIADVAGELVDVLADLHALDPGSVGLGEFGRPDGYLDRQLRRWAGQLDASRSREICGIDELQARLAAQRPGPGAPAGLVHGDYRLDNVIVGPDRRVAAVLDWELATLGDQLTDLGLLLAYWQHLLGAAAEPSSFPTRDRLAHRHAERTGADLANLPWYEAFAYFKLAVIAEGIHARYVAGQTLGTGFERFGPLVPLLVERGHGTLEAAERYPSAVVTRTRKNLTKAQRRDSIVDAARQVFTTSGLGARVREIAEQAGINEALIYQHFASKDELVAAAVVAPLERVMRELDATIEPLPEGSDEAQRAATAAFIRRFLEAFTQAAPMFGLIMFSDATTGRDFYAQYLVPVIDQAIHNIRANLGSWSHRDFDPTVTAPAGVGMCFWLAIDAHFRGTTLDIDHATRQLTNLLFDGVAQPAKRTK